MPLSRDEELALLIEEQRKDDTYRIEPQYFGRFKLVSLESLGGDPHIHALDPRPRHGMFRGGALAQIPHGTYNGYHNYGCHCRPCTEANTAYMLPRMQKVRKLEQQARPIRECGCGCGETFLPVPTTRLYLNKTHATRAIKRRERARWSAERHRADNRRRTLARAAA